MKRLKRVFCTVLSLCLLLAAALPVSAAEEDSYTYTVRFFAGRQGSFAGGEVMVIENLHYGDRVNFSQSTVSLHNNSKYYIRGIRESGKDNSTAAEEQAPSFEVTRDQDYVVAYGILGDVTSYTINYEDENGNRLAPSETYYGNVGDRPVVAYLYIAGYRPQAYNLTRTLKKDPNENIFTFVYTRDAAGEETVEETTTGVTVIPGGAGGAGAAGGAGGAGGAADAGDDTVEAPDEEVPQAGTPDELVNLDDEEVPLVNLPSIFDIGSDARLLGIPVPVVAASSLVLIGSAWYVLMKKKKKEEES